jgi:hypothetical protein
MHSGPVHVSTVSNVYDCHDPGTIVDSIDDPVRTAASTEPVI